MTATEILRKTRDSLLDYLPDEASEAITDVDLCNWVVDQCFEGQVVFSPGLGWQRWVGTHWDDAAPQEIRALVSDFLKGREASVRIDLTHQGIAKALRQRMSAGRLGSLMGQLEATAFVKQEFFTPPSHLLNVANGVVNLNTGELSVHEPSHGFKQVTLGGYYPGRTHTDWASALGALSPSMGTWFQSAVGQGVTGTSPLDDRANFLIGERASNGKSTVVMALDSALGGFAKLVSERVLVGGANDHPTERMQLFGARIAIVEELPQRLVSSKLLKDLTGRKMVARRIRQDNVQWDSTHTVFVTSNHPVETDLVDRGAIRRVRVFPFEKEYVDVPSKPYHLLKDGQLRERLIEGPTGQHDAVVTWAVEGAISWYQNSCQMPPEPEEAKQARRAWEEDSDLIGNFFEEYLEQSPDSLVSITELLAAMNHYLASRGHTNWRESQLKAAFKSHPVLSELKLIQERTRLVEKRSIPNFPGFEPQSSGQMTCWRGLKFRNEVGPSQF